MCRAEIFQYSYRSEELKIYIFEELDQCYAMVSRDTDCNGNVVVENCTQRMCEEDRAYELWCLAGARGSTVLKLK